MVWGNKFIDIPELEHCDYPKDWENWLVNRNEKPNFTKRDVIVKALAILLREYYNKNKITFKLPSVTITNVLKAGIEYSMTNSYATRIYNSIAAMKKSKYTRPNGTSKTENKFLEYKINYLDLSESKFQLLPEALFVFFNLDRSYETEFREYNQVYLREQRYTSYNSTPSVGRIIEPKVKLKDVILPIKTKQEIMGFVKSIKNRDKLLLWGVKYLPKLLLAGTIGTGKSISAEAIANELDFKLYRIGSEDIVGSYLGETAKNIGIAFKFASQHRDEVILFIDEIEGLIGTRSTTESTSREMNRAVNTFLSLMEEESEVLIISASNHAHLIDKAALSRFTKKIWFDLPTQDMLLKIFKIHVKQLPLNGGIKLSQTIAEAFDLKMSGRDIRNLVVEICQEMLSLDKEKLTDQILLTCFKRIRDRSDFQERSKEYSKELLE